MLSIILVSVGIILLIEAVVLNLDLLRILTDPKLQRRWRLLLGLIFFFIIGYVAFLITLVMPHADLAFTPLIIAAVFCLGAVFVVTVLLVDISMVKRLVSKNKELSDVTRALMSANENLERAETDLERKNEELKKNLEDFYSVRVSLAKDLDKKKVKQENARIRKRIDMLEKGKP
ncbi:hypothetical protein JW826_02905 [Candidatus Woesearchaeota archaeon]|nr:hypothetical protein [Candidatus Woesearchaeota archaeon]